MGRRFETAADERERARAEMVEREMRAGVLQYVMPQSVERMLVGRAEARSREYLLRWGKTHTE